MKVTIADVAKRAGVSKATVSRIMNGNYKQNKPDTIQKVLKVIEELDYQPNELAKSLKSMKTNVLGVLLSNLKNPFWVDVLEGIETVSKQHGYHLMICNSNEEAELEASHIQSFQLKQVDGIIMNPTVKNNPIYKKLAQSNFPMISINRKIKDVMVPTVEMDNFKGAMLAVNQFIKLGKKKIAIFVYCPEEISPRMERITGYKKAHIENQLRLDPSLIQVVDEKKGEAKRKANQLLSSPDRPDAILSTNNLMTLEILASIKELDLTIPNDVSLIGYDETVWSEHLNPPLTTVAQPAYKMGMIAAEQLINQINKTNDLKTLIPLEPHLNIRESCGTSLVKQ